LVLLLAWDTLLPTMGFLPVTSQTRAIRSTPKVKINGFRRTSHCQVLRGNTCKRSSLAPTLREKQDVPIFREAFHYSLKRLAGQILSKARTATANSMKRRI
jgi:hypothetical protein